MAYLTLGNSMQSSQAKARQTLTHLSYCSWTFIPQRLQCDLPSLTQTSCPSACQSVASLYLNMQDNMGSRRHHNGTNNGWASETEPIAIIGMSSKFAGDATDTDKLWRMLAEGRSGWTPFPASRFRPEGVYHPNNERLNSTHVKGAHFLEEDVGLFDAAFFSYSSETASVGQTGH